MIRAIGYLLAELFWSLVHRVFDKHATWDHGDDPDPAGDTAARTRWVDEQRRRPDVPGE